MKDVITMRGLAKDGLIREVKRMIILILIIIPTVLFALTLGVVIPRLLIAETGVKDKERFTIPDWIQGNPDFYEIKFDSDKSRYLDSIIFDTSVILWSGISASDEITSESKSSKTVSGKSVAQSAPMSSKAIVLVKNHPTLRDPVSGKFRSVERRMIDAKQSFFPKMTWRYEAEQIRPSEFRVKQHVYDGKEFIGTREWEVDISTKKVTPSNLAAQNLYR